MIYLVLDGYPKPGKWNNCKEKVRHFKLKIVIKYFSASQKNPTAQRKLQVQINLPGKVCSSTLRFCFSVYIIDFRAPALLLHH